MSEHSDETVNQSGPPGTHGCACACASNMKPAQRWFYFKHWLRVQVCKLRGHRLEPGHHLQASLFCQRCGRIQFYYHSQGLIVPASADLEYLNKLGIKNP